MVAEIFSSEPEEMYRVLYYISDESNTHKRQALEASMTNRVAFNMLARRYERDTRNLFSDPDFRKVINEISVKMLSSREVVLSNHGQKWPAPQDWKLFGSITAYNLVGTISMLPDHIQTIIKGIIPSIMEKCGMSSVEILGIETALEVAIVTGNSVCRVALISISLTGFVINNIHRWWQNEITGKECAKNIVDNGFSHLAGMGGAAAGAAAGSFLGIPGILIGGAFGGAVGILAASSAIDRITQWFFGSPKEVALQNAYRFLQVDSKSSNDQINHRFKELALKYHPDKGGRREDWDQLQLSMGIIREARGENQ